MVHCYTRANRLWKSAISFSHHICYGCRGGWEIPLSCCLWHEELFPDWSLSWSQVFPQKGRHSDIMTLFLPTTTEHSWLLQFKAHFCWHILCTMSRWFCRLILVLVTGYLVASLNLGDEEGHSFSWPKSPDSRQGFGLCFSTCIGLAYWRCKNILQVQKEVCAFLFPWNINLGLSFTLSVFFFFKFIWLCPILVAACGIF